MKRDWDVIREVLVEVEGLSEDDRHSDPVPVSVPLGSRTFRLL